MITDTANSIIDTVKNITTNDLPEMAKSLTSTIFLTTDSSMDSDVFENFDDDTEIFDKINDKISDKINDKFFHKEDKHFDSNQLETEYNNKKSSESTNELSVKDFKQTNLIFQNHRNAGNFDTLWNSITDLFRKLDKNKHKTIFGIYTIVNDANASELRLKLKSIAIDIINILEEYDSEGDIINTNEYRLKILEFYKYYNLFLLEELNSRALEINDRINNLIAKPDKFHMEQILSDIIPK